MSCSDIKVQLLGDAADILVYVQQAQAAVSAAQQAEAAAQGSATQAAQSATAASGSATAANESAINAAASEQAANQHVLGAQTAASESAGSALDAQAAANAASASAGAAALDATRAQDAADRAENAPARLTCEDNGVPVTTTTSVLNVTGGYAAVTTPSPNTVDINIPSPSLSNIPGLQTALDGKEQSLGTPTSDYQVLASTTDGRRHWVTPQSGTNGAPLEMGAVGQVQHPVDDVLLGDGLSFTVAGRVITLHADVTQAEVDNLQQQVNNIHAPTAAAFQTAFNQLIAPYGDRITTLETGATTIGQNVVSLTNQLDTALQTIQTLQNGKIDTVESHVNAAAKTLTLTFKSGTSVVDTDLIDLSGMFNANPPDQQHDVWFGFTVNKPPTEAQVKSGQSDQDSVITGHDITLQRDTASPAYMFVWVPDSLGPVNGFSFSHAFTDVWQSYTLGIDGVSGKVYVSDNQTNATSVSFEVM